MARIGKTAKRQRVVLEPRDYQYPGEKTTYLQAMGGVWGLFVILAGITAYLASRPKGVGDAGLHGLWQVPIILLLYPAITIMLLNFISQRPRKKELKELGLKARVMRNSQPELAKLIADEAAVLCAKEPEAYIVNDEAPYLYSVPGKRAAIIISTKTLEVLKPEEMAAALAHEMGHIKSGHVSVDLAITAVRSSNPLLQIVFLPVTLMSFLMRGWLDTIDYTADRCSLLIVRRTQTCTGAMVKLAAAQAGVTRLTKRERDRDQRRKRSSRRGEATTDRDMAAEEVETGVSDISPEELDAYLAGGGEMGHDPVQVERAFKISRFIQEQRNLGDRIKNLGAWLDSDEGEAAMAKVDEVRAQLSGTQSASG